MLDLRLRNATFLTMDDAHPLAHELGVWGGRIVGVDEAVARLPARRVVDLGGATVLPGFIDAHVHLAWTGLKRRAVDVSGCRGVGEVLALIGRAARRHPENAWLDVAGYDQRPLGRHITAAELDRAAPGRRVLLAHDSGHACVVSTPVLDLLPAGVPHQDGLLTESAAAAARALRRPYSLDELTDAVADAAGECLRQGVTACAEAGIGGGLISHSAVELAAYQRLREAGRLPLRVRLMVAATALHEVAAHPGDGIPRGLDLGLRGGFGDDRLALGALKIFTDGGMMARTAALSSPYAGLDHAGQLYDDPGELTRQIAEGHRAGWQLAIHAIGDRAVDLALDALAEAQRAHPRAGVRHRVEHAGLVRPDQLPRLAAAGVTAVVQPGFLWSFGDDYAALMGAERAAWLYRGRAFLDHGVRLAASSDRPVVDGAPLRAVQFMVERRSSSGALIGPEEGVTVEQALRAYTVDAAHACHWEHALGSLAPGRLADLVVLGDDPRRVDPSRIADIEVVGVFVEGRQVEGQKDPTR
ncbi:amidohydrolase [Streptomyces sp. 6N223]|uniref:amidohydrolase n=1 Tax=Streptomyces sp. 6N223 TaxID=3457412 RepID=UPI003FCF0924